MSDKLVPYKLMVADEVILNFDGVACEDTEELVRLLESVIEFICKEDDIKLT